MVQLPPIPDEALRDGLRLLFDAYNCARDLDVSATAFAIEIAKVRTAGLSDTEVRWLCGKQYVQHLIETTIAGDTYRTFRQGGRLIFHEKSCFLLMEEGAEFANTVLASVTHNEERSGTGAKTTHHPTAPAEPTQPKWDSQARELRVGNLLVKNYRQRAPTQERILSAFEEEGWPRCIDDPLPPVAGIDSRERLHSTIKRLNHNQLNQCIIFQGDGTGQRIVWDWLDSAGNA